jgi:tetratricopeptide (TPR) repeat protein
MNSMTGTLSPSEEAQLQQTIEMFEMITQSQPNDCESLEILKDAYLKLGRSQEAIATSKQIAQAYVQIGQLSSAILEYETILQNHPDDPDVVQAMACLETKARTLTSIPTLAAAHSNGKPASESKKTPGQPAAAIEDGRVAMRKLFVDAKLISAGDFEACWSTPSLIEPPGRPLEPFIQVLADKAIVPLEKSLRLLSESTRLGYLPLERYDLEIELARSFPRETCQRWCVLPFDKMSKSLLVATANPFNKQAAQELQGATSHRIVWCLSSPVDLVKILRKVFR